MQSVKHSHSTAFLKCLFLAKSYTTVHLIRPQKSDILRASQVYTDPGSNKDYRPNPVPVYAEHLRPIKKTRIIEFPFLKH